MKWVPFGQMKNKGFGYRLRTGGWRAVVIYRRKRREQSREAGADDPAVRPDLGWVVDESWGRGGRVWGRGQVGI